MKHNNIYQFHARPFHHNRSPNCSISLHKLRTRFSITSNIISMDSTAYYTHTPTICQCVHNKYISAGSHTGPVGVRKYLKFYSTLACCLHVFFVYEYVHTRRKEVRPQGVQTGYSKADVRFPFLFPLEIVELSALHCGHPIISL